MISLTLPLLLTLLSAEPETRLIALPLFHAELRIPGAWAVEVEEHPDLAIIRDARNRGCRVSLTRHNGSDAPEVIRRVHERLYLGSSLLPQTRGEAHVRTRTARPEATFGEYARKGTRRPNLLHVLVHKRRGVRCDPHVPPGCPGRLGRRCGSVQLCPVKSLLNQSQKLRFTGSGSGVRPPGRVRSFSSSFAVGWWGLTRSSLA